VSEDASGPVVISGATRGLGRALAEAYAAEGRVVVGCGRSTKDVAELRSILAKAGGDASSCDVADAAAVEAFARDVVGRFGAPRLLVNNAALINRSAPLWEIDAAEFDAILAVNVSGVANMLRAFLPPMIARGRGVVVNLSSGWGRSTDARVAPYCATKFAIEGLTGALAQETPEGIVVVALNPGVVDTDMLRTCWSDEAAAYEKPKTWAARAAPFLLSLEARDHGGSLDVP
jgi:NAD(P)-dependent dehydrogenase (short-subunit alcohol dehydrogenase family)